MNSGNFWETDKSPGGKPLSATSNHPSIKVFDLAIRDGDSVVLRVGEERILVHSVREVRPGRLQGTIRGFETSMAHEFQGRKAGDVVEFNYDQVFSVSHS